jgi:perosamine synthetase
MKDYGNPNIYRTPRYSKQVENDLSSFINGNQWDDWDLIDLLNEVPHNYATKAGVKHGIFCSTGTSGLHASLMALELLPEDEVIVPCMTFIRAVTPLVHLGLQPVLCDIDPLTGNISPESIKKSITIKTRAVIVVHMWGIPCDMKEIVAICKTNGLFLIEDFSHSHFSKHKEGYVGSFGDVSFASLQRKKTLSVGEGGIIFTKHTDIYKKLQQITSPGSFKNSEFFSEFSGYGLNLRMSPFSASIAKSLLNEVDLIVETRIHHTKIFSEILEDFHDFFTTPFIPAYAEVVSPYGYKPVFKEPLSLSILAELNKYELWKFSSFSYDHILSSKFWSKTRANYPFCQNIKPICYDKDFIGYNEYVKNRFSLSIPTINKEYWTDEVKNNWKEIIAKLKL